jgi:thiol-disulfide isomerase/thioredoxin
VLSIPLEVFVLLARVFAAAVLFSVVGCEASPAADEPKPSRFNAATKKNGPSDKAARSFCEQTFAGGEGGVAWKAPAEKALPAPQTVTRPASKSAGWTWVNLWATWCRPCVEELALLDRWQTALEKDGLPIAVELWSVDDGEADLAGWLKKHPMPGTVKWLKGGAADLPAVLGTMQVPANSPIPVHALVDGNGKLRCVRVGAVHDEDYAAIKAIIAGG